MMQRLLLVDDSKLFLDLTKKLLQENGFEVETALSGEEALKKVRGSRHAFALVILDYLMTGKNGATTAREILAEFPDQYILMCSNDLSRDALRESWKAGAVEFIDKSSDQEAFLSAIKNWSTKYEQTRLAFTPPPTSEFTQQINSIGMIGASARMAEVVELVLQYRNRKGTALILGESGTGKERVARALHHDKDLPFFAVNCATYNSDATLMESELFGAERGAYTGATHDRTGIFEEAGSGTVFLDEVHTLSLKAQQKLLRVLQDKVVRPVGGAREYKVHFRLIAAAKTDLEHLVERGDFLADLYFRLNVLRIELPPLRERPEDIPFLVNHFCNLHSIDPKRPKRFVPRALQHLQNYSWPGNVRELESAVERLCATVTSSLVQADDLDSKFFRQPSHANSSVHFFRSQVNSMTRDAVVKALQETRSQRAAAKRLGLAPSTFHGLLKRFGLHGGKRGRKPSSKVR